MAAASVPEGPERDRADAPDDPIVPSLGTVIAGTYRITRHLGSGGNGHVFEAEHLRLGKPFALKMLRADIAPGRKTMQRFRREARALARVTSEHVVSVVDCGELGSGTPYLVMERLVGEDLRSLLNRAGALLPRRAVQIVVEACRGLTVVHEADLVHRDLKPENLFLARRSTGEDWCKVLDFGVARMQASQSTAQGAIVGTVRYMAPEQLTDVESVGPQTDVYALGAILHECLTGKPLHDGATVQAVMYSVMNRVPVALDHEDPLVIELSRVVALATSKTMADRPASTAQLAELLERALRGQRLDAGEVTIADDDAAPAFLRHARRSVPARRAWLRTGGIFALAVCVAAGIGWSARSATLRPPESRQAPSVSRDTVPVSVASAERPAAPGSRSASAPPPALPPQVGGMDQTERPLEITKKPRPSRMPSSSSAPVASQTAKAPDVTIGRFDSANPYGD